MEVQGRLTFGDPDGWEISLACFGEKRGVARSDDFVGEGGPLRGWRVSGLQTRHCQKIVLRACCRILGPVEKQLAQ